MIATIAAGKKTYILLHGAWHASWCWKRVAQILMEHGHKVIAPDLPGHGKNTASLVGIDLNTYVDFVATMMQEIASPVTLVGHSMAGIIISQLAERMPEKVEKLVYVAAFIPENNHSLADTAKQFGSTGVSTEMLVSAKKNEIALKISPRIKELFFNQSAEHDAESALALLQTEPLAPFLDHLKISNDKFGRVRKVYVECLLDKTISIDDQRKMHVKASCEAVSLNADHSPFFSAVPALVEAISLV